MVEGAWATFPDYREELYEIIGDGDRIAPVESQSAVEQRVAVLAVEVEVAEFRAAEQTAARHRERTEQERSGEHGRPQRRRAEH